MSRELPPALAKVTQAQHGVFSRRQALLASGLSPDAIKSRVRRETWRRVFPGVYTTSPETLSRLGRLWAAVLYAGPNALISHETAAELHGLTDEPSDVIHVSIPRDRRVTAGPGLRVHRTSRAYDPPDAHRDPPQTTIEETLLDLVDTAATFDDACAWITGAFGREVTSEPRLLHELSMRPTVRWHAALTDVIGSGAAGDHSVLEYRYTRDVERAHRLPEAKRQVPFRNADGSEGRRDRVYEDYGVAVELDGQLAHPAEASWRDKARDRAAAAQGLQSLRYGWTEVHGHPCETAAGVASILTDHGWDGTPRRCSPSCPVQSRAGKG
jgi:very-short-patch-repair endonuclease